MRPVTHRFTSASLTLFLALLLLGYPAGADTERSGMQDLLASNTATDSPSPGFNNIDLAASLGYLNMAFLQQQDGIPNVLDLESAVSWALDHNREIERLRLEALAAGAARDNADLLYMPTLDLGGTSMSMGPASTIEVPLTETESMEIETGSTDITSTLSLTLTQPVYMFGSFGLAQRGASIALDQARLNLARAEQTVRMETEGAFLDAALTRALVSVSQQAVDSAEERLRIAEARFDAGDVARFEILRAEVSLATSSEELLRVETSAELAMSAFVQKIGLPSGTAIEIIPPDPFEVAPEPPGFTLEDARQYAISNRTDLRNLELAVELAQVGIDTQRNRPALLFQGSYSQADRVQGFGDRESWSLMLNLSYTLFDSGRAETAADEARARRDALAVQLDDIRSLVELEVEAAYRELTNSLERIEVARATLETASEALRIAELGYSEGVITYIDYKDADLGLRQAETLHLQAVYQYLIARSTLRSALGVSELP